MKIYQSTKGFVRRNAKTIVVAAVLGALVVTQARGISSLNNFLTEKGLFEEYYGLNKI